MQTRIRGSPYKVLTQLKSFITSLTFYMTNTTNPQEDKINEEAKPLADFMTLKQLVDLNITSIPFLWDGIFPQTGIGFITGPSDSNKSTFMRQLAYAIVHNKNTFLGRSLNVRYGQVLLVSTEDGATSLGAMVRKQGAAEFDESIQQQLGFYFKPLKSPKELDKILSDTKVDLIGFDTWTDNFSGDLNSTVAVRENLAGFKAIAEKYGCFILGIHHTKKGVDTKRPDKGQMLGSQGLEAYSRIVLYIRRDEGTRRVLSIVKGNYTPDELKDKPIVVDLNVDNMHLTLSEDQPSGYGYSGGRSYDKEMYMPIILSLQKQGYSQDKIVQELEKKFKGQRTPSKGLINSWLKEPRQNSQSDNP